MTGENLKNHRIKYLIFFFFLIVCLAILKVFSLNSSYFDLGIFDRSSYIFSKTTHCKPLVYVHAHIFSFFYGFLYKFFPSPILLLTCQTLAIILAGVLVAKIMQKVNLEIYKFILWLYILYFAVWYNCLFAFHFEHLFILCCAIFYWLLHKEETVNTKITTVIICILACLVKEVFALSVFMMGIYIILKKRWYATGGFICIFSAFHFVLVTSYVIPYFSGGKEAPTIWADGFSYLGSNMKEVIINLLTHPWLLVTEIFSDLRKLLYIVALLGPFLFTPFLSPLELLPALPQLFISLLSHKSNFYALSSQYTAGLIVPVFVAFGYGIKKLEGWNVLTLKRANVFVLLSSLFFHIIFSPSPISRIFWVELVPQYHYTAYIPTKRDAMIKEAVKIYIPPDFNVSVSTQNTVNCAHLAHRHYYFCFPRGVTGPAKVPDWSNRSFKRLIKYIMTGHASPMKFKEIYADYVVLDLKRQWFVNNRGCNKWRKGQCYDTAFAQEFLKLVDETKRNYDLVYENDGFMIFKRQ